MDVARTRPGDTLASWQEWITRDPAVLAGKAVVRGTRISVELILELLAEGWSHEQVIESYPALGPEALRAVFAYAADLSQEEDFVPVVTRR